MVSGILLAVLLLPLQQPAASEQPTIYKIGGDVSAPITLVMPDPGPDLCAPRAPSRGCPSYELSLTVDREGIPQDVRIVHSTGTAVQLQQAIALISKYRFKPAIRKGEPVAVAMHVEISIDPF